MSYIVRDCELGGRVHRSKVLRTSDVDGPSSPTGRPHRGGEGGREPAPGLGGRSRGGEAVQHDLQRQRERRRHLGILQVENTLHFAAYKEVVHKLREFTLSRIPLQ